MNNPNTSKDRQSSELTELQKIAEKYDGLLEKFQALQKEKEENEAELRAVNASKDRFFSIISHDLRNPFVPLLGYADLLSEHYYDFEDEEKLSFIKEIQKSSKSIIILLDNLMQWSRSQRGVLDKNITEIQLADLAGEIIEGQGLSIANKKLNVLNNVPDELTVHSDKNTLSTVIRNLLANAVKFTPEKGTITLFTNDLNESIEFHIKDTGVGIKEENAAKLFNIDTNYTTLGTAEEEGTGLGLILCKEFVEAGGGKIWVESEPGKGSDFIFTIPKH